MGNSGHFEMVHNIVLVFILCVMGGSVVKTHNTMYWNSSTNQNFKHPLKKKKNTYPIDFSGPLISAMIFFYRTFHWGCRNIFFFFLSTDRENFFAFHAGNTKGSEPLQYPAQKMTSQVGYEDLQQTGSLGEVWGSQKNSIQQRRDLDELLTTACCRTGCKKKDLNSLC